MSRRVLLLNASYEPLGIVSVPRAVRLVWKGTAETVEQDGARTLRSQHFEFPCPSVVRLVAYVDVRGFRGIEPDGEVRPRAVVATRQDVAMRI